MKQTKRDMINASDKFAGQVEVAAGKITGNQQMELKGHVKVAKAEIRHELSPKHVIDGMKKRAAGAVNKNIDS
jgi:uncharacterized protein YjbJ (UPF0337 family)